MPDPLLLLSDVNGIIVSDKNQVQVHGSIRIDQDGSVIPEFAKLNLDNNNKWLIGASFPSGRYVTKAQFNGTAESDITLRADRFFLHGGNTSSDPTGSYVTCEGEFSDLQVTYGPMPETSAQQSLIYFAVGMKGFNVVETDSPQGRVALTGPPQIDEPDHLSGRLVISAGDISKPLAQWHSECDQLAENIFDIMSLAQGRFIRWSVRRLESESGLIELRCHGPQRAGPALDGVFPHLNLKPALDLAVARYTPAVRETAGLRVAIEWFVHHPRYDELALVSAMTALEHLVEKYVSQYGNPKIVDPGLFANLLKLAQDGWDESSKNTTGRDREDYGRLKNKLSSLNDGSFLDELEAMLAFHKVPLQGLDIKHVKKAVRVRNLVVHTGLYRPKVNEQRVHVHVAVLRELLKRIFLTLLAYEGQYFSLLNGPEWKQFPSDMAVLREDAPSSEA